MCLVGLAVVCCLFVCLFGWLLVCLIVFMHAVVGQLVVLVFPFVSVFRCSLRQETPLSRRRATQRSKQTHTNKQTNKQTNNQTTKQTVTN